MPSALDLKVFVPSKNFDESLAFYLDLGWQKNWSDNSLAELELAGHRFYLQKYYHKGWANNFMMYIDVEDAQAWYDHIVEVLDRHSFKYARVNPPKLEPHALVTYAWDPCGVLLHFAQGKK